MSVVWRMLYGSFKVVLKADGGNSSSELIASRLQKVPSRIQAVK